MTHLLLIAAIFGAVLVLAAAPLEWWTQARTTLFTLGLGLFVGAVVCCGVP